MQQNTGSLSAILAPIVAENARLAAQAGPKAEQAKRIYQNVQPVCDRNGVPFVAPYDVN
jgi:hypothetical protein